MIRYNRKSRFLYKNIHKFLHVLMQILLAMEVPQSMETETGEVILLIG